MLLIFNQYFFRLKEKLKKTFYNCYSILFVINYTVCDALQCVSSCLWLPLKDSKNRLKSSAGCKSIFNPTLNLAKLEVYLLFRGNQRYRIIPLEGGINNISMKRGLKCVANWEHSILLKMIYKLNSINHSLHTEC